MSITYTATLPVRDETVLYLSGSAAHRASAARHPHREAGVDLLPAGRAGPALVARRHPDEPVGRDNKVSLSTGYDNLHEAIEVLAAQAPGLHVALLAAKAAGYDYVLLDGTLIETDRVSTPGPTPGVDLWWSEKHNNHGGNIQVLTAPDGWPLWTSPVRPGREHDTTCLRTHPGLLTTLAEIRDDVRTLADLGYEGEADTITVAFKKPRNGQLTDLQQTFNRAHNRLRAIGERGNSLLKITFKALRNVSLCPWNIGNIIAAALVILHIDHARTT